MEVSEDHVKWLALVLVGMNNLVIRRQLDRWFS
jgi:hypothetical protein